MTAKLTPEARAEREAVVAYLTRRGEMDERKSMAAANDRSMSPDERRVTADFYRARADGILAAMAAIRDGMYRARAQ